MDVRLEIQVLFLFSHLLEILAWLFAISRLTGQVPYQDFTCPVSAFTRHIDR